MGPLAKMLAEVRQQNSKLEKGFIIERYCRAHPWIQTAIRMAYDPFYQFYVKKGVLDIPVATKLNLRNFDQEMWTNHICDFLRRLNNRELTKSVIQEQLGEFFSVLNEEDADALRCIIFKDLRMGMAERGINNALLVMLGHDLIPVPDTQLCMTWSPGMRDNREVLWATPKINGLRGRWKARDGSFRFLTREDYPLIGFDAIENELLSLCAKYDLKYVDGEVFSVEHPFQTIMSIARGNKKVSPQLKDELMYYIFNIQPGDRSFRNTQEMVDRLNSIDWWCYPHLVPVPYTCIKNSPESIIKQCQTYSGQGWEGIVLRDPDLAWEGGKRNRNLMKYKLFYEDDFTVTGVVYGTEGKKLENQIVALRCEGALNTRWVTCDNGDCFRVPLGPGEEAGPEIQRIPIAVDASCSTLTDTERSLMTTAADTLIGKTAEIRFQAITDHADGEGFWSLQFPTFLKFKD